VETFNLTRPNLEPTGADEDDDDDDDDDGNDGIMIRRLMMI
jgi:hypothetical protein